MASTLPAGSRPAADDEGAPTPPPVKAGDEPAARLRARVRPGPGMRATAPTWGRAAVRLLVATAGGAVLATAFPGRDWWFLAAPALAVLPLVTIGRRPRTAAAAGLAFGLGFFVPHLQWSGIYVGWLPWFALAALQAGFVAAVAALLPAAWRAPGGTPARVLAFAGLWVAQEAARSRVPFGGFPWGRVAFSQADAPSVRLASWAGAPAVSFAVALAAGALAAAALALIGTLSAGGAAPEGDRRPVAGLPRRPLGHLLAAAALLAGPALVPVAGAGTADAPAVTVAAVQGNVPRAGLEFNAERRAVLDNHVSATLALAAAVARGEAPRPDLVLWPENSSDIDPLRNADAAAAITRAADAIGVPVLVGAVLQEPVGHLSNAGIVWRPGSASGGPGERYVKRHPAPFAEYIPYRSFFRRFSDKVDLVRTDFAPGRDVGVLPMGRARVGDVICFEVAYDGLVRDAVLAGATLLAVQTNNATFGRSAESVQQLAMSRLRAVESGRAVVHVSTVGVSALIRPDGSVVRSSSLFTREVLQAPMPLRTGRTPAVRAGAWPEAGMCAVGLVLCGAGALRGRAARRRVGDDRGPGAYSASA